MGVPNSNYKQLCWSCEHACNKHECVWVRTLKKHYKGTKLDADGYIIECPKYKHDGMLYTIEDKAKALGITKRRYQVLVQYIKRLKHPCTIEEFLKRSDNRTKLKLSNKELIQKYSYSKVKYAYKIIRDQNLKISVQEYLERHYGVKNE